MKQAGLEQLIQSIDARNKGNVQKAEYLEKSAVANLIKLKKTSPTDFRTFSKDILSGIQKESDTTYEKLVKEMLKTKDAGRLVMLFNTLKTVQSSPASGQKP